MSFLDARESTKLSFLLLEPVSNERVGFERDSENVLAGYNHQTAALLTFAGGSYPLITTLVLHQ